MVGRIATIKTLLTHAKGILAANDIEKHDAVLLLSVLQGKDKAWILANQDKTINDHEKFIAWVMRRAQGEPLAKIIGYKEFWSIDFQVSTAVLDPRPDTETLIELALSLTKNEAGSMLDLGTGSGCIVAAFLSERHDFNAVAIDISSAAISLAKQNCAKFSARTNFYKGDWFKALPKPERFDIIFSNPPYIASKELSNLTKSTLFDPILALDGGEDGLDCYREIFKNLKDYLKPNGFCVVECGFDNKNEVVDLATSNGLQLTAKREDLQGYTRALAFKA